MSSKLRSNAEGEKNKRASVASGPAADIKQRILDAAALCVERSGVVDLTIDDIVLESGVSRATVYRRYATRDVLLADLFKNYFEPFEKKFRQVLADARGFVEEMEALFIWSVTELEGRRWLKDMFKEGVSPESMALFNSLYMDRVSSAVLPYFERAQKQGELRGTLNIEELQAWYVQELMVTFCMGPKDHRALSHKFRHYILPVMVPDADLDGVTGEGIYQRLDKMEKTLKSIQRQLHVAE